MVGISWMEVFCGQVYGHLGNCLMILQSHSMSLVESRDILYVSCLDEVMHYLPPD